MIDYSSDQKPALYGAVELGGRTIPNVLAGKRVMLNGSPLNEPSDYALALLGAAVLHARAKPVDPEFWRHALAEANWSGAHANPKVRYVHDRRLTEDEIVSVDDRNGVVSAVPSLGWKACMVRTLQKTAVAHACNIRLLLPAKRVPGGVLPDSDGAPIPLGDLVKAVDRMADDQPREMDFHTEPSRTICSTPIYPAVSGFDDWPDFENPHDPLEVGRHFAESFSGKLAEWLDRVVLRGDGATEPFGALTEPERGDANRFQFPYENDDPTPGAMIDALPHVYRKEAGARVICVRGPQPKFPDREATAALAPFILHPALREHELGVFCAHRYRIYIAPGFSLRTETAGRLMGGGPDLLIARQRVGGRLEHQLCAASNI